MRFSMITAVVASAALAIALDNSRERLCSADTASNPVCCSTNIIGAASLDCATPRTLPNDIPDFKKICAEAGQQARCCLLVVADVGLLCSAPI